MGMTTDDPKPYRVNLRINEEMNQKLQLITKQSDLTIAEYVRSLISGNKIELKEDKQEDTTIEELMSMVKTFGLSYEEFIKEVTGLLEEGLIYEDHGLKTREHDLDVTSFKERCDAMGISYQSALDKLTKGMR